MEKNSTDYIKIKVAISLKRLFASVEHNVKVNSHGKIADNAEIRKATVTNTLNAKTLPDTKTLLLIIEAMGVTLTDFAIIYDSVKDSEIHSYKR